VKWAHGEGTAASERDTILLDYPADDVFRAAVATLAALGTRIEEVDAAERMVTAKKAMSLWSWGERITVRVSSLDANTSAVRVESRERAPLQVIDWGKNARNIDDFEAQLRAVLEGQDAPAESPTTATPQQMRRETGGSLG
jgi:hypothetical protein